MSFSLPSFLNLKGAEAKIISVDWAAYSWVFYLALIIIIIFFMGMLLRRILPNISGRSLEIRTQGSVGPQIRATSFVWQDHEYLILQAPNQLVVVDKVPLKAPASFSQKEL